MKRKYLSFLLRNKGREVVLKRDKLDSLEIDLVHHCGKNSIGQFVYILTKKAHRINFFKGDVEESIPNKFPNRFNFGKCGFLK